MEKLIFNLVISEDGSTDGTKESVKKIDEDIYPMILISDN